LHSELPKQASRACAGRATGSRPLTEVLCLRCCLPYPRGGFSEDCWHVYPKKWDEKPYDVIENRMKSTKVSAEFAFSGDLEGTASVEYLMFYKAFDPVDPHRSVAQYVGLIQFSGTLKGKFGSFAMIDNGTYEAGAAISKASLVAGSGTGELSKITGEGGYKADQTGCTWQLEVLL